MGFQDEVIVQTSPREILHTSGDVATGQAFTSGWGKPINRMPGAKIHWYNSENRPACGRDSMHYAGERLPSGVIMASEICTHCLTLVEQVIGDLGNVSVAR